MKTINLFKVAITILLITFSTSCSSDDDSSAGDSREVKYEITGNATGTFDSTYITGSGSGANETPTALPWSKTIVVQANIAAVSISAGVISATPGQTITVKIFVGGVMKKEQDATVQANGTAIVAALQYTFN